VRGKGIEVGRAVSCILLTMACVLVARFLACLILHLLGSLTCVQ
jgi:hypothetical protein